MIRDRRQEESILTRSSLDSRAIYRKKILFGLRQEWVYSLPVQRSSNYQYLSSKEHIMPYVSIRVAGTLTRKQKENICKGVTNTICQETGKPPEAVLIFIDEVVHENIAKAGKLLEPPK